MKIAAVLENEIHAGGGFSMSQDLLLIIKEAALKTIKLNTKLTLIRKTIPNFNKITKIFKIRFKILLYKYKYIYDQFLEIHTLRIYNLSEYHNFYNKIFELKNIYRWMSFSKLKENYDWHGFMILK
jgi:hypothetical protein